MHQPVVLIDLQHQPVEVQHLQQLLEHYAVVYLFHPQGHHPFGLDVLTDLAQLIYAQDVVILEHAATGQAQYDYALVAGQLVALLPHQSEVHLISAMPHAPILLEMLELVGMKTRLISTKGSSKLEGVADAFQIAQAYAQKWQQKLISSLPDSVQKVHAKIHPLLQTTLKPYGLDKQKIQRKVQDHQAYSLVLNALKTLMPSVTLKTSFAQVVEQMKSADNVSHDAAFQTDLPQILNGQPSDPKSMQIDPLQFEVAKQLHLLKTDKPKDIYALRDFLETSFPESDVRRLLKELLDKGYIYCDGVDVLYSYEMFVN